MRLIKLVAPSVLYLFLCFWFLFLAIQAWIISYRVDSLSVEVTFLLRNLGLLVFVESIIDGVKVVLMLWSDVIDYMDQKCSEKVEKS